MIEHCTAGERFVVGTCAAQVLTIGRAHNLGHAKVHEDVGSLQHPLPLQRCGILLAAFGVGKQGCRQACRNVKAAGLLHQFDWVGDSVQPDNVGRESGVLVAVKNRPAFGGNSNSEAGQMRTTLPGKFFCQTYRPRRGPKAIFIWREQDGER